MRSSSEIIVITKWTNQVLFCFGYLVQIKQNAYNIFAQATKEFQKFQKNMIFQEMRKKSTFVEISSILCFLKLTRPVYYQLN